MLIEKLEEFPQEFEEIIEESFIPYHIFNVDEMGLFWTQMPARSVINL